MSIIIQSSVAARFHHPDARPYPAADIEIVAARKNSAKSVASVKKAVESIEQDVNKLISSIPQKLSKDSYADIRAGETKALPDWIVDDVLFAALLKEGSIVQLVGADGSSPKRKKLPPIPPSSGDAPIEIADKYRLGPTDPPMRVS